MAHLPAQTIGILCAIAAAIAFTLNDAGVKFLSGDYPLHEVVLIRALTAIVITLAIIMPLEGGWKLIRTNRLGMHLIRGLLVAGANMVFFAGLAALELAEATAIFFISPLVITAFSVFFLKEKVGIKRWSAVVIGLVGMVVMVRPGTSSFQLAALLPMLAACLYAGLHMLTRKMSDTERASTMALYIQVSFIFVCVFMGLFFGDGKWAGSTSPSIEFLFRPWIIPSAQDLLVMMAIGIASATGGYCISQAYRVAEAATIAPFEYFGLLLAIIWGMLLFGEYPDFVSWVGMALIAFAGLFVFFRESKKGQEIASERPLPRSR